MNDDQYSYENLRLMGYNNQYIYPWHVHKHIYPNERLTAEQKKPVGYFSFHQGKWVLVNQAIPDLRDLDEGKDVPVGGMLELKEGQKILLSKEDTGRLLIVQLVSN